MSRVGVIGLGYVGLTTAVGLSKLGHKVLGYDLNESKVSTLANGQLPILEEGLEVELQKAIESDSVVFVSEPEMLGKFRPDFVFICVGTPQDESGAADLSSVFAAVDEIQKIVSSNTVIVTKSTVPVGTGAKILRAISISSFDVASNPEFLREGTALKDFMEPDRIVVGASSRLAAQKVMDLYSEINAPKLLTTLESAELSKYASNVYLAMRLSFTNDIAELSARSGAKVDDVLFAMGLDKRIGPHFLKPGPGWGGSCFPKDARALLSIAKEFGAELPAVTAAIDSNEKALFRVASAIAELTGGELSGKTVGVWGLAFKANTDDVRDSPAIRIVKLLIDMGGNVRAYDPVADTPEIAGLVGFKSAIEAATGADVLAVLTEWDEFAKQDPEEVATVMKVPAVFDGRRVLPESWRSFFVSFGVLGGPIK
jgi:UDPglucose 6-dehydrogenase